MNLPHTSISVENISKTTVEEPQFGADLHSITTSEGLTLRLIETTEDFDRPDEAVLYELAWSGYVDRRDEIKRVQLISNALGRRVIAVDNPGVGHGTSSMPESLASDVRRGDFSGVARNKLEALQAVRPEVGRLALFGWSLGASTALAAAKESYDMEIDKVVLAEIPNLGPTSPPELMARYGVEGLQWYFRYLRQQKSTAHTPVWMSRRFAAGGQESSGEITRDGLLDYARALTKSNVRQDSAQAVENDALQPSTPMTIVNTQRSWLSTGKDNDSYAEFLVNLGLRQVSRVEVAGESHLMIDAPTKLDHLLKNVA